MEGFGINSLSEVVFQRSLLLFPIQFNHKLPFNSVDSEKLYESRSPGYLEWQLHFSNYNAVHCSAHIFLSVAEAGFLRTVAIVF